MATNNQAEAYALYQDLNIATSLGIRELVVIGDSRIQNLSFHVLWDHNGNAEGLANEASGLSQGILKEKNGVMYSSITP